MRIVVYTKHVKQVSGVQTFERSFIDQMSKQHEIIYLYDAADEGALELITGSCQKLQNKQQPIKADVCIYSSIEHSQVNVEAHKYIQMVHCDLHAWNIDHNPEGIDVHVCVGSGAAKSLKEHNGLDSVLIPNMLGDPPIDKVVSFMTATRIASGKGIDRIAKIGKKMQDEGYKFIWDVYGKGSKMDMAIAKQLTDGIEAITFKGPITSVQSYMKKYDYVAQLSDNEGFCYSVYEALQINMPVIVTDWEGVREAVFDGVNGYILDMELTNLNLDTIFSNRPLGGLVQDVQSNALAAWSEILN